MTVDDKQIDQRMHQFSERCRCLGLKETHQRTEIFRELAQTDEHPDAETIYRRVRGRIPVISLDTVYRTMRLLEEKQVIARVGSPGERARFDANVERHSHFVCRSCGGVQDCFNPEWDNLQTPQEARTLGVIESVQIELRGICTVCQAQGPAGK